MQPLTPTSNAGRTAARDDIHHKTADGGRAHREAQAKACRHAARQEARLAAKEARRAND